MQPVCIICTAVDKISTETEHRVSILAISESLVVLNITEGRIVELSQASTLSKPTYLNKLATTYRRQSFVLQYENVVGLLAHLGTAEDRRDCQSVGLALLNTQVTLANEQHKHSPIIYIWNARG